MASQSGNESCPHCGGGTAGWKTHNLPAMRRDDHPGFFICEYGHSWPAGDIESWKAEHP